MTRKNPGVPGNTIASQVLFDQQMMKLGIAVTRLQSQLEHMSEEGIDVTGIKFLYRGGPTGEVLGILTAHTDSAGIVAFQSGEDLGAVLRGMSSRVLNGSIKWKEDQYAKDE